MSKFNIVRQVAGAVAALWLLAGCGGPGLAEPTALPPDVVRPEQPAPVYQSGPALFSLATPLAEPVFLPTPTVMITGQGSSGADDLAAIETIVRPTPRLFINLPPSALGIATGGATIYDEPGGAVIGSAPSLGIVNVTGRSADGRWLAMYLENGLSGWVTSGSLRLFGDDDLTVIDEAPQGGPIATLVAQAMLPVNVLDELMVTLTPQPTPQATPEP